MTAQDMAYVALNGGVSVVAVAVWMVAFQRACRLHRVHHDARSMHVAQVTLAVLIAALGTLGPILIFLGTNLGVLGEWNGLADSIGRVMAGAGRASLLVAGLALVLDRDNWKSQR